jgi:predicted ATPase/DNA-binding SARP family transcriptional activator
VHHNGRVEIRALGAIGLVVDGQRRALGPAQRLLLAALVVNRRQVVSADALGEALWGESPPPTARTTLQTHLSKLRRAMGESGGQLLVNRPPGYALDVGAGVVDADLFEASVATARQTFTTAPGDAAAILDDGLSLWGGAALSEFADATWACTEASRLDELRLVALELRNDACLVAGSARAVIVEMEGLVHEHPLRERFWLQLMVALHRSGRQAEALRVGHALRSQLRDELGLVPSAAFRAIEEAVVGDDDSLAALTALTALTDSMPSATRAAPPGTGPSTGMPPVPVEAGGPSWTPGLATQLVGRADDLDRLAAAVERFRLVTLTGPGGVGKSTVAAELGRRLADHFGDGVRFVELAAVHDAGAVMAAVAHTLDVERRAERSLAESITEVLGPRRLLMVLDNCEHLVAAVGELVTRIVRWCPEVRLLATSREPIGIAGENVWPLAPLDVPASVDDPLDVLLATPAVQVFVARAEEAAPAFEMTERSAPAIADLCIQLDGLPLALELAAARMASMSPHQLAERLHERFALLGGASGRDPRHRTLVDLVQWSYELLSEKERILLARLSVFAGGFDLEAAEQVCGVGDLASAEVAHLLAALVDKSLVVANHTDDRVHYLQLETLRQFGADRLPEQPQRGEVHRAHLRTFVERAEVGAAALEGRDESAWADRLEGDLGNLRVALHAALTAGDADSALRLVAGARELAFRRIRYELMGWAEAALSLDGAQDHPLQPTVLAIVGYGSFVRGELGQAVDLAEQAIAARDRLGLPSCGLPERVLGNAVFYRGDHAEALRWMDHMVEAARASRVHGRLAHALYMRSVAQTSVGDREGGLLLAEEADLVAERSASPTARAQAAYAFGLAMATVDVDAAIDRLDRSAELATSVGNRWMRAFAMTEAMWLRAGRGETSAALKGYRQVVETWFQGGDWANQWLSLRHLAGIFASLGRDEEAALLFGSVDAAGATAALPFSPVDADALTEAARAVTVRLGPTASAEAARRGAMMRDDATVAAALHTIASLV